MLQLGARYYWPEIGRFISQDPIGKGSNWYGYVGSNPVVHIDPEGLDLCGVLELAVSALEWLGFEGSTTVSAYPRLGGSVTIGRNPNGAVFLGGAVGVGLEVGFVNDLYGTSPNWNVRRPRLSSPSRDVGRLVLPDFGPNLIGYMGQGFGIGASWMGHSLFSAEYHSGDPAVPHGLTGYSNFSPPSLPGPSTGERGFSVGGHAALEGGIVCD